MVSQLPSFCSKLASVLNPMIFALSHPKFREALTIKCPCLGIGDQPQNDDQKTAVTDKEQEKYSGTNLAKRVGKVEVSNLTVQK